MAGVPNARLLFDGSSDPGELAKRRGNEAVKPAVQIRDEHAAFVEEMTKATIAGLNGETEFVSAAPGEVAVGTVRSPYGDMRQVVPVTRNITRSAQVAKAVAQYEMAKAMGTADFENLSKEWTLTNPIPTGLLPFDLEAPAKLLTPRPTPLRNSTPRLRGQGGARRFKVISGFTGTGTGGATTMQPGINESTTNVGPGGLNYVRGPYISYDGFDVTLNYVTTSLSDSVSWQQEYQGQGFEDVRSLSNTALLYSTMLIDERLMCYGRGVTSGGYAGPLGAPGNVTLSAVSASLAPGGTSSLTAGTSWVVVAADAGDLLGITGTQMHQSATTVAASVAVTAGQAIQVTVGTEPKGAVGYNLFVGSVAAGPFYYAGRTGYNVGYVTSQPSTGPVATSGQSDQSAVSDNYDGLITNTAASGGYVTRLNAPLSTTSPAVEFQTAFGSLYESVKGDPEVIWMNGFDRLQLSNAITNNAANSAYAVFIQNQDGMGNVRTGTVVSEVMNEVTGSGVPITVHPWFPQGTSLIQQKTLPIPDSNVSETSVMVLPQDYIAVQWPVVQFTYDASTFEIGTMCHYAPAWNGLIQGIQGVGIGVAPPSYSDS